MSQARNIKHLPLAQAVLASSLFVFPLLSWGLCVSSGTGCIVPPNIIAGGLSTSGCVGDINVLSNGFISNNGGTAATINTGANINVVDSVLFPTIALQSTVAGGAAIRVNPTISTNDICIGKDRIVSAAGTGIDIVASTTTSAFSVINNYGSISGFDPGINIIATNRILGGTINNKDTGSISGGFSGTFIPYGVRSEGPGFLTSLTNEGTITSQFKTIYIKMSDIAGNIGGISNGIVNTGTITTNTPGQYALYIDDTVNTNGVSLINSGTIDGKVYFYQASKNVPTIFQMDPSSTVTPSKINGDVSISAVSGQNNAVQLNGGEITGVLQLGGSGGVTAYNTVKLAGTQLNIINGGKYGDVYTMTGGDFNQLLAGIDTDDFFQIPVPVIVTGTIDGVEIIQVDATGSFQNDGLIGSLGAGQTPNLLRLNGPMTVNADVVLTYAPTVNLELLNTLTINVGKTINTLSMNAVSTGGTGKIINSGTIDGGTNPAIISATGVNIAGIFNTGLIESTNVKTIDLTAVTTTAPLNQQPGGTITGNVYLASSGGIVLDFSGGIINGNVFGTTHPTPSIKNILNISGGSMVAPYAITLGNNGDTLNLSGTAAMNAIVGGTGADTFNVSGGDFVSLTGDASDLLFITGGGNPLETTGSITNVGKITVDTGTTFKDSGITKGVNLLTLNGPMIVNAAVTLNYLPPTTNVILDNTLTINTGATINTIALDGTSSGGEIDNSGTINGGANPAIISASGVAITGIFNSGLIESTNTKTIDLSAVTTTAPLNQETGGTITGDVYLASSGGTVLDFSGGTINGDVFATTNPTPTIKNILDINGGSMVAPYTINLGNNGDTLNLSGTASMNVINGGTDNDIFNWSGGAFVTLDGMGYTTLSPGNTLNINAPGPVSPFGNTIKNIQTINVNVPVVNFDGTITDVHDFNVNANFSMIAPGSISGDSDTTATFTTLSSAIFAMGVATTLSKFGFISFGGLAILDGAINDFTTFQGEVGSNITQNGSVTGLGTSSTLITFGSYDLQSAGTVQNVGALTFVDVTKLDGNISAFSSIEGLNTSTITQLGTITGDGATSTLTTNGSYDLQSPTGLVTDVPILTFKGLTKLDGAITNFDTLLTTPSSTVTQTGSVTGNAGFTSTMTTQSIYTLNPTGLITQVKTINFEGITQLDGTSGSGGGITNFGDIITSGVVTQTGTITGKAGLPLTSTLTNNNIYTLSSSGSIIDLDRMNINKNFINNGLINNINTIDVKNTGTIFTTNNDIANINTLLKIGTGASILLNGNLSGTADIINNGTLAIDSNHTVNMSAPGGYSGTGVLTLSARTQSTPGIANNFNMTVTNYHQINSGSANGTLNVEIIDPIHYGAIKVNGGPIIFDAGTIIHPLYTQTTFMPNNTIFPIIQSGPITDNGVMISETPNVVTFFYKQISHGGTEFDLIFKRQNLLLIDGLSPIAKSIAPTINGIFEANGYGNPEFINLILQFDKMTTIQQVNNALEALSPDVTYGTIEGAHIGMDRSFNILWQRLEDIRWYEEVEEYQATGGYYARKSGYSYGDCPNQCPYGIWVAPYGEWLKQKKRSYDAGYEGNALGIAAGYDRTFLNGTVLGVAANYTRVHVKSIQGEEHNVENVASFQGTLYGMWQPIEAVYVDLMVAAASNKFQTHRNINIGDIHLKTAGSFYGWQYGGQLDIGYVDCQNDFYIVPIGRFKATYLDLQNYTEQDAGSLSLSIKPRDLMQLQAGGGFRFAREYAGYPYSMIPEISALALYDFSGQPQQTVANFVGGGTIFPTIGVKPPRAVFLIDLGLEIFAVDNKDTIFTTRFECELREKFMGYSGFIEFYQRWF